MVGLQLFMENLSQSYDASPARWDHTVLPAYHPTQVNALCHNPNQTASIRFTYPERMEG